MKTFRFSTSAFFFTTAALIVVAKAQVYGHWEKTWRTPSTAKGGMNIGIAFSGENTVRLVLQKSAPVLRRLQGAKYISIGGGNENGRWSRLTLQDINRALRSGQFHQYRGIAYNVEEGDPGLSRDFEHSFRLAKEHGLHVLVAVSNSAPYGITDRNALMRTFLASRNIDYLSPMLYESGDRGGCGAGKHVSTEDGAFPWSLYRNSTAKVVPSLLYRSGYSFAQEYLRGHGVRTYGFIQWCV